MNLHRTLVATLLLAMFSLATAPLSAQPLADQVPGDAIIYVGWRGAADLGPGYDGSHLKAVLEASNFKALVEDFLPRAMQKISRQAPHDAEALAAIITIYGAAWKHPSALYFGGVDYPRDAPPRPRLALFCQAGKDAPKLAEQIEVMARDAGDMVKVTVKDGLITVVIGELPADKGKLAGSAKLTAAMKHVGRDPALAVFVDVESLVSQIDEGMRNTAPRGVQSQWIVAREVLGLASIKTAALTCGFDGKDWSTRAFVAPIAPGVPLTGLASLLDAKPVSDAALKLVPKNAAWMWAGRLDVAKLIDSIRAAVAKAEPRAAEAFDDGLKNLNETLGFDLHKDFLEALGDEWVIYSDNTVGGSGPFGTVIANKLRDPRKFEASLAKLQKLAQQLLDQNLNRRDGPMIRLRSTQQDGMTIHFLSLPVLAPAWAVKGDAMIAGLYPQTVVGAADQAAGKTSILDNPRFTGLRKRLGGTDAAMVTYFDLPQSAGEGYQAIMSLSQLGLGLADMFGVESPAMVIPPLSRLLPHLDTAGSVTWMDKDGWHLAGVTPFPGAEMLAMQNSSVVSSQAMLVGIMLPALGAARRQAHAMQTSTQARGLVQGCVIYAQGANDKFPPDLATLVENEFVAPDYLISPRSTVGLPPDFNRLTKEKKRAWLNANTSFCYITGLTDKQDSTIIVLFEKPIPGEPNMSVAYSDVHVERLPVHVAAELIKKQTGRSLDEWIDAPNPGAGGK